MATPALASRLPPRRPRPPRARRHRRGAVPRPSGALRWIPRSGHVLRDLRFRHRTPAHPRGTLNRAHRPHVLLSRRVRRLLPALCVVLVFVAVASVFLIAPRADIQSLVTKIGVASSVYLANAALFIFPKDGYFAISSNYDPLLHMWTLGAEEQFYLLFPALVIFVSRLVNRGEGRDRTRALIWTIAAIALLSFVAGVWLAYGANGTILGRGSYRSLAFYASPTRRGSSSPASSWSSSSGGPAGPALCVAMSQPLSAS